MAEKSGCRSCDTLNRSMSEFRQEISSLGLAVDK
jgi:hypothetical protein